MKKVLTLTLLSVMILGSCKKERTQTVTSEQSLNYMVALRDDGKTENSTFLLALGLGHSGKNCKGCFMVDGHLVHINCMGAGNDCAVTATVQLQHLGATMTATTIDTFNLTTEDFFLMPDRSLLTEDERGLPVYLNIPAQLVYRDSSTLQFTFTGLYYSENAAYGNY